MKENKHYNTHRSTQKVKMFGLQSIMTVIQVELKFTNHMYNQRSDYLINLSNM